MTASSDRESASRLKTSAPTATAEDAVRERDEALALIRDVRSELASLHWYAHQYTCDRAGITKEGVLIEFGNSVSEIGMALNFLTDRIGELCRQAVTKQGGEP